MTSKSKAKKKKAKKNISTNNIVATIFLCLGVLIVSLSVLNLSLILLGTALIIAGFAMMALDSKRNVKDKIMISVPATLFLIVPAIFGGTVLSFVMMYWCDTGLCNFKSLEWFDFCFALFIAVGVQITFSISKLVKDKPFRSKDLILTPIVTAVVCLIKVIMFS